MLKIIQIFSHFTRLINIQELNEFNFFKVLDVFFLLTLNNHLFNEFQLIFIVILFSIIKGWKIYDSEKSQNLLLHIFEIMNKKRTNLGEWLSQLLPGSVFEQNSDLIHNLFFGAAHPFIPLCVRIVLDNYSVRSPELFHLFVQLLSKKMRYRVKWNRVIIFMTQQEVSLSLFSSAAKEIFEKSEKKRRKD